MCIRGIYIYRLYNIIYISAVYLILVFSHIHFSQQTAYLTILLPLSTLLPDSSLETYLLFALLAVSSLSLTLSIYSVSHHIYLIF